MFPNKLFVLALLVPALATPVSEKANTHASANKHDRSLAALAKRAGKRYFGTAWSSYYLAVPEFGKILDDQFSQYTPENEMKWEVIQPERGVFNWTGSDIIVSRAKKTSSKVRGHNFVWHQQIPQYVNEITDPTVLKAVLKEHIDAVMGRYGKDLYAFDVVNEPFDDNAMLRDSVWYKVLGEDYFGIALDMAHAAAPKVKLYINDYNIESVNAKSTATLALAKKLLAQGKPLHGIGFESHFIGGQTPKDIGTNMKRFTDLGLDVAITELDVRVPVDSAGLANSSSLAIQAKDYADVVQACLANARCPGVTVWGFGDSFSWIPGTFPGEGAADLYDFDLKPKPAFDSVKNVF